jgi:hypothetical protein
MLAFLYTSLGNTPKKLIFPTEMVDLVENKFNSSTNSLVRSLAFGSSLEPHSLKSPTNPPTTLP